MTNNPHGARTFPREHNEDVGECNDDFPEKILNQTPDGKPLTRPTPTTPTILQNRASM